MNHDDLFSPGVKFLQVVHEDGCPGAYNNGNGCNCSPSVRMVDEAQFLKTAAAPGRAERRAAARATAKAMAKAKGGKQ